MKTCWEKVKLKGEIVFLLRSPQLNPVMDCLLWHPAPMANVGTHTDGKRWPLKEEVVAAAKLQTLVVMQ